MTSALRGRSFSSNEVTHSEQNYGQGCLTSGSSEYKVRAENTHFLDILTFGQLFSEIWEKQGPNI